MAVVRDDDFAAEVEDMLEALDELGFLERRA
jgi:hypothetical protein